MAVAIQSALHSQRVLPTGDHALSRQGVQVRLLVLLEYFPASQDEHNAPTGRDEPALHVQSEATKLPGGLVPVFAGHDKQKSSLACFVTLSLHTPEYLPLGQLLQLAAPELGWNVPDTHCKHF